MTTRTIKFGFNHMIAPSLEPDELVDAAVALGAVAIELRNDVGDNSLKDIETARRVGAKAASAGLEVRSVNALYPFNVWNEERARQTDALAALAAAAAPTGLVMCPLNEGKMLEDTPEKAAGLRAALAGDPADPRGPRSEGLRRAAGFSGLVLAFQAGALAAIDAIDGADVFSLVHDTFHHRGAGERRALRRAHRPCAHFRARGPCHQLHRHARRPSRARRSEGSAWNVDQLRQLYADGYDGVVSFEPFAKEVHDLPRPVAAVRDSMTYLRQALAMA